MQQTGFGRAGQSSAPARRQVGLVTLRAPIFRPRRTALSTQSGSASNQPAMPVLPVTDRRRLFQQGAIMNPINRLTQSFQPSAGRGLLGAGLRGDRQRS